MDPRWGVLKAAILEVAWFLTDEVALSEVAKPVPPYELLLVCWGYLKSNVFTLSLW